MPRRRDAITDVPGIRVGHWTDRRAATGCTVVLCPAGAVGGVSVRGAAPGTRETDVMRPGNLVDEVHAVLLTGGSAFGLDAAGGVMRYLHEHGHGFIAGDQVVPIVPAAALYDLGIGRARWPDAAAGYRAASRATGGKVAEGSVGAGMGATVAKIAGAARALRGGIGTASEALDDGTLAAALVAVNAWGAVRDPLTGTTIAAPRAEGAGFIDVDAVLRSGLPAGDVSASDAPTGDAPTGDASTGDASTGDAPTGDASTGDASTGDAPTGATPSEPASTEPVAGTQTTLAVVATDARLSREQANRLAEVAHNGLARAIWPAHTQVDGDVVFALSTGEREIDRAGYMALEALATRAVERAVIRGIEQATDYRETPAVTSWARW